MSCSSREAGLDEHDISFLPKFHPVNTRRGFYHYNGGGDVETIHAALVVDRLNIRDVCEKNDTFGGRC